jgi:cytochrome c oxidase assembly factor CtaG
MFWSSIAASGPSRYGVGVLAVFGSAMAGTGLGAAMLLAPHPWYPIYARAAGAGALADQQLAGVVMWSFMGLVDVIAAVVLFARWLAVGEGPLPSFAGASR